MFPKNHRACNHYAKLNYLRPLSSWASKPRTAAPPPSSSSCVPLLLLVPPLFDCSPPLEASCFALALASSFCSS
ncbi:hypothetical protein K431DRAFT_124431 [Polychaeton citri CBS 116435]|uniref:Uncharacterized protein n=1 Tax=Polychaeton citri CBS 116435 TaxID=1314669 RepID=A0A9P4Q6A7_9PEZI|nr:hypothetical protein K431DRAFT_124431 [Polychaeton citri CBS 116435]